MKVKVTLLGACILTALVLSAALWPSVSGGQKKATEARREKLSITVGEVTGLRIVAERPLVGSTVPLTIVTVKNVSERPIAAAWITDGYRDGQAVALRRINFYEDENYLAPGETFELSPTETGTPNNFTAIVYADGSAEGREDEARELAANRLEYLAVSERFAAMLATKQRGTTAQSATSLSESVHRFIQEEKANRKTSGGLDALNAIKQALEQDPNGTELFSMASRFVRREAAKEAQAQ